MFVSGLANFRLWERSPTLEFVRTVAPASVPVLFLRSEARGNIPGIALDIGAALARFPCDVCNAQKRNRHGGRRCGTGSVTICFARMARRDAFRSNSGTYILRAGRYRHCWSLLHPST